MAECARFSVSGSHLWQSQVEIKFNPLLVLIVLLHLKCCSAELLLVKGWSHTGCIDA